MFQFPKINKLWIFFVSKNLYHRRIFTRIGFCVETITTKRMLCPIFVLLLLLYYRIISYVLFFLLLRLVVLENTSKNNFILLNRVEKFSPLPFFFHRRAKNFCPNRKQSERSECCARFPARPIFVVVNERETSERWHVFGNRYAFIVASASGRRRNASRHFIPLSLSLFLYVPRNIGGQVLGPCRPRRNLPFRTSRTCWFSLSRDWERRIETGGGMRGGGQMLDRVNFIFFEDALLRRNDFILLLLLLLLPFPVSRGTCGSKVTIVLHVRSK